MLEVVSQLAEPGDQARSLLSGRFRSAYDESPGRCDHIWNGETRAVVATA